MPSDITLLSLRAARRAHTSGASQTLWTCARKIVHYALAKPTKEGLYAALPADVQHWRKGHQWVLLTLSHAAVACVMSLEKLRCFFSSA